METRLAKDPADAISLIDAYLAQQRELTAVEQFARRATQPTSDSAPAQKPYYRDLIPARPPQPGEAEQYAFEVDLDACSGCKACVAACHSLNGLDDQETWRSVGLLVANSPGPRPTQHITAACHHCLEPACLEGCPVMAYEKDGITGIVRHLDDQCIGCQYCILKCPYDVPKYNRHKGIVRKCDMCSGRLAVGEAPACVQSCPSQAISIRVVKRSEVLANMSQAAFLPGVPDADYTKPTTRYKSARPMPADMAPADLYQDIPQHAHWPLVIMLVLTQLSIGAFTVGQVLHEFMGTHALVELRPMHAMTALIVGLLALGASTLHLGRPLYAFRAFLGLRTSWMSREIIAFGLFAKLAIVYAACLWLAPHKSELASRLCWGVVATGLLGVFCSVMIYHDTQRTFWRFAYTAPKFLLTTLLLGLTATLQVAVAGPLFTDDLSVLEILRGWGHGACLLLAAVSAVKIILGLLPLRHLFKPQHTAMKRTALLAVGPLLTVTLGRFLFAFAGGVVLPLLAAGSFAAGAASYDLVVMVVGIFAITLAAEVMERYLFFTAVVALKMPGALD